jgi:competence protein ComEA
MRSHNTLLTIGVIATALCCHVPCALAQRTPAGLTGVDPDDLSNRIDLNSCTLQQLQSLPGVSPDIGARIMAGRPYESFDDLARDSIPLSTIAKIRPLVILGPLIPVASPKPNKRVGDTDAPRRAVAAAPLDLNTATSDEIERMLGVRPAMARWIISGRPYRTLDDLTDAGIPQPTIDAILMLVVARQVTIVPPRVRVEPPEELPKSAR